MPRNISHISWTWHGRIHKYINEIIRQVWCGDSRRGKLKLKWMSRCKVATNTSTQLTWLSSVPCLFYACLHTKSFLSKYDPFVAHCASDLQNPSGFASQIPYFDGFAVDYKTMRILPSMPSFSNHNTKCVHKLLLWIICIKIFPFYTLILSKEL